LFSGEDVQNLPYMSPVSEANRATPIAPAIGLGKKVKEVILKFNTCEAKRGIF